MGQLVPYALEYTTKGYRVDKGTLLQVNMIKIVLRNQATSILRLSRIIESLDRKKYDVITAISINDDRQNRFKAAFSNILEFN